MHEYDVVIPVSYKDCWFLRKNIPYIRRNLVGAQKIYVLTSPRCFRELSTDFCYAYDVVLIDENQLTAGLSFSEVKKILASYQRPDMTGWYFQQFLKIAFALSPYSKAYYLVWDADTIPLNQIEFFDGNKLLFNPKKEYHKPYFETIQRLYDVGKIADYSFISEHMMVKCDVVEELICAVGNLDNWWKNVLDKCDLTDRQSFSEFETIGTYCLVHYPGLYQMRLLRTFRGGGAIFGRQISEKELALLSMDFDTVSFERGSKPFFPRSISWIIMRLFIELKYRLV